MKDASDLAARLRDDLADAYAGDPWHGPSFRATLDGLTAAAAHPVAGAHSAWEIVEHVTAWLHLGARRLDAGAPVRTADDADWPPAPPVADDAAGAAALDALDGAYHALAKRVGRLDGATLGAPMGEREPAQGTGGTVAFLVSGLVQPTGRRSQHLAYHGGQIALLRRAQAGPATPEDAASGGGSNGP